MDITQAIRRARPGENEWSLYGDAYSGLVWREPTPKPTEVELQAAWDSDASNRLAIEIKAEAERRITEGCLVGGTRFRCDDQSVTRIHGLASRAQRLEDASQPVNIAFRTAGGETVVIESAAAAWAVFDAAAGHVAAVLAASAALQADPPADFRENAHWP